MKPLILSFGEVLWDIFPDGAKLGGAPFNFAYRAQNLGAESRLISRIGQDEDGDRILARMKSLAMSQEGIQRDPLRPTGLVDILVDAAGNPDFSIRPDAAYDAIDWQPEFETWAKTAKAVCFGTVAQRTSHSRATLQTLLSHLQQAYRVLDLNLRKNCYDETIVGESLSQAEVLKINLDEAKWLATHGDSGTDSVRETANWLIEAWDLSVVLITLGGRGLYCRSTEEEAYAAGYKVQVRDTTGSGDACTAAFVTALVRGASLQECAFRGNGLGAMVAMQQGATEPVSELALSEFLEAEHQRVIEPEFRELV